VIMFIGRHVHLEGRREVEGLYVYRLRKKQAYSLTSKAIDLFLSSDTQFYYLTLLYKVSN
jgi:hypothetical protein